MKIRFFALSVLKNEFKNGSKPPYVSKRKRGVIILMFILVWFLPLKIEETVINVIVSRFVLAMKKKSILASFVIAFLKKTKKNCIGRESNPGRPRGRRAFYH